jgi:predicted Rossmann fold flavoprotein
MTLNNKNKIAIIGGGPAGMMASIIASENLQNDVYLFEKNNSLGKKLLITGSSRCNITNAEKDVHKFINSYGKNGKFLFSAFSQFFNNDLLNFFESFGVKFVTEKNGRVFPKFNDANEIMNVLLQKIKQNNVNVKFKKELREIQLINDKFKLIFKNSEFIADKIIVACGGKSYPTTGSTGEIFEICKKLGHKVVDLKPSLVPLELKEVLIKYLEGLSLEDVEVCVLNNNKKIIKRSGEMIFTRRGVSGPVIFEISKYICRENLENLILSIDLKPNLKIDKLNFYIRQLMNEKNITFKNLLKLLLPIRLADVFLKLLEIDENKKIKHLNKQEINRLCNLLKNFNFYIADFGNFNNSMATSGGIDIKEINPKTMESKIIKGLYFAGEVIDIDGITGGYNLQSAFSTGYVAGKFI